MKKITIYKDFEAQKRHEIAESLKMTPGERIAHVVVMIKRLYPSMKPVTSKRIHFKT